MKQNELNREIARMTGETVDRIQRMGFNLVVIEASARPPWRGNAQTNGNVSSPRRSAAQRPQPTTLAS